MEPITDVIKFLPWDTEFFGQRIARVIPHRLTHEDAQVIDLWCEEQAIDCVYLLADSQHRDTVRIAEDYQYRQVDVRILYEQTLNQERTPMLLPDGFYVDQATAEDQEALLNIIDNTFSQTRFYYDTHFTNEQANQLYKTWLIRSLEETFADRVIVVRRDDKPQGFVVCVLDQQQSIGSISLLALAPQARGKKLGSILLQHAFDYFQQAQMQSVTVVTQARNIAANRLYQSCGFRTADVLLWYHKWFS